MHYSPASYYTLGATWPRERAREVYPRRRRRSSLSALYHRRYGPLYFTACTLGRSGLACTLVTRVA